MVMTTGTLKNEFDSIINKHSFKNIISVEYYLNEHRIPIYSDNIF